MAMYKDVLSGFLFLTNPKYLHPCRQCRGRKDDIQEVFVSREYRSPERLQKSSDLRGGKSLVYECIGVAR